MFPSPINGVSFKQERTARIKKEKFQKCFRPL